MEIVKKILVRETCPNVSGWYDTNKGNIYWNDSKEVWSCRSDRVSEEFPEWWLEEFTERSSWNEPAVSKRLILENLLERMQSVYPEYYLEIIQDELDGLNGC